MLGILSDLSGNRCTASCTAREALWAASFTAAVLSELLTLCARGV